MLDDCIVNNEKATDFVSLKHRFAFLDVESDSDDEVPPVADDEQRTYPRWH